MPTPTHAGQRDAALTRRALDRLAHEQSEREQREQAEAEQREQQARAEFFAQRDAAEAEAVARFAKLRDAYTRREATAKIAVDALAEFFNIESELHRELKDIDASLFPFWQRSVEPTMRPARWAELRRRARLGQSHRRLHLDAPQTDAERIGLTALGLIVGGMLRPGVAEIGGKIITFDFSRGA